MKRPGSKIRPWIPEKPLAITGIGSRTRDPFYHNARWTRESRIFRIANPLCELCYKKGIIVASEVTDHKIPKDLCEDPWDKTNWMALCNKCHAKKGSKDKQLFKQKRT